MEFDLIIISFLCLTSIALLFVSRFAGTNTLKLNKKENDLVLITYELVISVIITMGSPNNGAQKTRHLESGESGLS